MIHSQFDPLDNYTPGLFEENSEGSPRAWVISPAIKDQLYHLTRDEKMKMKTVKFLLESKSILYRYPKLEEQGALGFSIIMAQEEYQRLSKKIANTWLELTTETNKSEGYIRKAYEMKLSRNLGIHIDPWN